jgi:uncharacterized protein with GYD domain
MATFILFGKYSRKAMQEISAERTEKAEALVEKLGGKVTAAYALLGEKDLIIIADFPGTEQAMQGSAALGKLTGISFTTSPAVTIEVFDKLMAEI